MPELSPEAAPWEFGVTLAGAFGLGAVAPPEFSGLAPDAGELGVLGDVGSCGVDGPALVSARTGTDTLNIATADITASILMIRPFISLRLQNNATGPAPVPFYPDQATTREDA